MKKILFVQDALHFGGAERSLLSLLAEIDFTRYSVDLLLLDRAGALVRYLPKEVNLVNIDSDYNDYLLPFYKAVKTLIKKHKYLLALGRVFMPLVLRITGMTWPFLKLAAPDLPGNFGMQYDVVIGYHASACYFTAEKINVKRLILWYHGAAYRSSFLQKKLDYRCYKKADKIITVSEKSGDLLSESFPDFKQRICVVKNIVPRHLIQEMSQTECEMDNLAKGSWSIVSVGRLTPEKGFDMAVEACFCLKSAGYQVKWYIVGEGNERGKLRKLIGQYKLDNELIMVGEKLNPYTYIRCADIYVQPSRQESYGIAIAEAMVLNKPVVATDTSGARSQISDGYNGLIVDCSCKGIAGGIKRLINDQALRNSLSENLQKKTNYKSDSLNDFYKLINSV